MSLKSKNTALLVFIREPQLEASEKVFSEHLGSKGNQKIAHILNKRIIKLCKSSGFKTFIHSSLDQQGATFGERFANAFEFVFEKGFDNVIAVGNDCLAITKQLINKANAAFNNNSLVIGPALDGGLYLVGMSKQAYNRKRFLSFHWQTPKLGHDFMLSANREGLTIKIFETASDIDNANDLIQSLKILPRLDQCRKRLERLLVSDIPKIADFLIIQIQFFLFRYLSLRAPPI